MKFNWFCYHHNTPTDAKLTFIAKKAGALRCEMTAFWDCLLDHASQHINRGYIGDIDLEVISFSQEVKHETLQMLHALLVEKEVIVDGFIAHWETRQNLEMPGSSTERVREYRRRIKEKQQLDEIETPVVTNETLHETKCNDETDGTVQYSTLTTLLSKEDKRSEFQKVYDFGSAAFPILATSQTTEIPKWIASGCSPELDIIPEIERQLKAKKTVKSWSFFTGGIMDAKATRETPLPPGKTRKGNSQNPIARPYDNSNRIVL